MVVRKAVKMLNQLNIPIFGLVENLSYFVSPETGTQHAIFGPSHAQEIADLACIPAWTRLPIDPQVAIAGDNGQIETVKLAELNDLVKKLEQAAVSSEKK